MAARLLIWTLALLLLAGMVLGLAVQWTADRLIKSIINNVETNHEQ